MLNWITPNGLLIKEYEEEYIDIILEVDSDNIIMEKTSGDFPNGINLTRLDEKYHLIGHLPKIEKETEFNFVLSVTDGNETIDRWFSILILNKSLSWKTMEDRYTFVETTHVSLQLEVNNLNGDEKFVKIKGSLPPNLQISDNGLIYGNITDIQESKDYAFTVAIKKDNEYILDKDFIFTIKLMSEISEPIWVTTDEVLGRIDYNEMSSMFVKAIDTNGLPIFYMLGDNSNLPYGLTLNSSNGRIEGICKISYTADWKVDIIASNGKKQSKKSFLIRTNTQSDINYDIVELGTYKIGETVEIKLSDKVGSNFEIMDGELPNGLKFNKIGIIYGTIEYQTPKEHTLLILERHGQVFVERTYTMSITKGYGYNATDCYLYLNNEYMDEYMDMKQCFNIDDSYNSLNPKYMNNIKPRINIATCQTYDQILIRHMLTNINRPLSYIIGNTKKISMNDYDVYYKDLIPETQQELTVKFPIHPYSRIYLDKVVEYFYSGTSIRAYPTSEVQVEYIIQEDEKIIKTYYFIDEYYEKIYVDVIETYYEEGTMIKYVPQTKVYEYTIVLNDIEIKKYYCDNSETYTVFYPSVDYIRSQLSKKIGVKKLKGSYYYKVSNQKLIDDNFEEREFIIKYDERRKEYYAEYLGEKKYIRVYAEDRNGNISSVMPAYAAVNEQLEIIDGGWSDSVYEKELFGGLSSTTEFQTIEEYLTNYKVYDLYIQDGYENTDVNYHYYFVTEKDENMVQENILFRTEWNPNIMFVNEGNEFFMVKKIENPYVYDMSVNSLAYTDEIVLPYVTDEDVNDNTVCFFNVDDEKLIEWKEHYYPTIDIFYSKKDTNILSYQNIIEQEKDYKLLFKRKIMFYEVHFEPKYNNQNSFAIDFYEHNNKNSPSFQLI